MGVTPGWTERRIGNRWQSNSPGLPCPPPPPLPSLTTFTPPPHTSPPHNLYLYLPFPFLSLHLASSFPDRPKPLSIFTFPSFSPSPLTYSPSLRVLPQHLHPRRPPPYTHTTHPLPTHSLSPLHIPPPLAYALPPPSSSSCSCTPPPFFLVSPASLSPPPPAPRPFP